MTGNNMLHTSLMILMAVGFCAQANTQSSLGFLSDSSQMPNQEIVYAYDLRSSNEWSDEVLKASELFPGFKSFETWDILNNTNETVIYVSEVAFTINKTVSQSSLDQLGRAEFLSSIDPGFSHTSVTKEEANDAFSAAQKEAQESAVNVLELFEKKGKISAEQRASLTQASQGQLEKNLSLKWCESSAAQCVKSTAKIPTVYKMALSGVSSTGLDIPDSIDIYSELKPVDAGALQAQGYQAGVTQTGFLANKTLVSLKNTILSKDLGNGSSLITVKTFVVIEKDDLDRFSSLGSYDVVVGNSFLNTDEGITMGLPLYSQRMAEALREKL